MLVLTRKLGEAIAIGDDIKIVVMQIKGKYVRLGIKASPTTVVHREEVYVRVKDENRSASQISMDSMLHATQNQTLGEFIPVFQNEKESFIRLTKPNKKESL